MIRIGVLGCGRIVQLVHFGALQRVRGASVIAFAESDDVRRSEAARRMPGATAYADYRQLLQRPDIDAVLITLPPALHAQAAIDAFDAGRHVYVEKPLATEAAAARAMLAAQQRSGRIGMIGFNFRFHPLYRALRARLDDGLRARVVGVRTTFGAVARALPAWKTHRETGGGVLLDLAPHHIDLIRYLFRADVLEVAARTRSIRSEHDTAALQLRLSSGIDVQTFVTMTGAEDDRIEVIGADGIWTADRYREGTLRFTPAARRASRRERVVDGVRTLLTTPRRVGRALAPPHDPSFELALQAFIDAVAAGAPSPLALDEGLACLDVVLAAEDAARTGRSIELQPASARAASGSQGDVAPIITGVAAPPAAREGALPAMSVVLVATAGFASVRRTVRHLRAQTIQSHLELILVGPDDASLAAYDAGEVAGFAAVRRVAIGQVTNIDRAAAHGIRVARAPIVALVEDHAYPEPGWAQAMLRAHEGPWAGVGSTMVNANPASALSWANLLLAYGGWVEPVESGETRSVPLHNITFKRAALQEFEAGLEEYLGRDGGLLQRMLQRGHRFFIAADARIQHANPSLLSSTVALRINAGRISAATRARVEGWSPAKRLLYVVASPLIPLLRARPLRGKTNGLRLRAYPALGLGLVLDSIGQAIGFAAGPGDSARKLVEFEFDRLRHVNPLDRQQLMN